VKITYTVSENDVDLYGILSLQRSNLPISLSQEEALEQGFVTVMHDFSLLKRMNAPYPHIIARAGESVVGYTLVMLRELRHEIPVLVPMFAQIDKVSLDGLMLKDTRYFIMGQVCIARTYRGQGVFQCLYEEMVRRMSADVEYIVTEVSLRNPRSLRAHEKVGFRNVREYRSEDGEDWVILALELRIKN